jgi:hypothetical protein
MIYTRHAVHSSTRHIHTRHRRAVILLYSEQSKTLPPLNINHNQTYRNSDTLSPAVLPSSVSSVYVYRRIHHPYCSIIYTIYYTTRSQKPKIAFSRRASMAPSNAAPAAVSDDPAVSQEAPGEGEERGEPDPRGPGRPVQPSQHELQHTRCCRLSESAQGNRGACGLYFSTISARLLC